VSLRRADGTVEAKPAKFLTTVNRGDVLRVRLAGAGGWGEPLARDPTAVLEDVREGKVSIDHAHEAYRVVIAGSDVDEIATSSLRARRR
jgi:N-methylhydantoinase B